MKTLSNAELQEAIDATARLISKENLNYYAATLLVHLENLTDEQRKRATDELTLEPIESTLDRVDFDTRVRAQDGPEWVEHDGSEKCPAGSFDAIEYEMRSGDLGVSSLPENLRWWFSDELPDNDIMKYRIIGRVK